MAGPEIQCGGSGGVVVGGGGRGGLITDAISIHCHHQNDSALTETDRQR